MPKLFMTVPSCMVGHCNYPLPIYMDAELGEYCKVEGRVTDFPYDLYRSAEEYLAILDNKR